MLYRVVFAPEADDQLEALYRYIADKASPAVAEGYASAIIATCERLATMPHRGVARDDVRPGLRVTHHAGRTVIAYAIDDPSQRVSIVGLFYGGQDYARALAADSDGQPRPL